MKKSKKELAHLFCPSCGSEDVTLAAVTTYMANTGDHYCHSVKTHDPDAVSECLACDWKGRHDQLTGYGKEHGL